MYSITNWLQNNKVAVCLYLYHTDLWPEFEQLLIPIQKYIKLYIGLPENNSISGIDRFDHSVSFHENYGADVAPFLEQLKQVNEPIFIKLHSKKSLWGFKYHINWRQFLLNDLIGSEKIFKSNIKALLAYNNVALCNKTLLMSNREFLNSAKIKQLCDIINIDYSVVKNSQFSAGNMFAGKTDFYKRYLVEHIPKITDLLYNEKGKVDDGADGTYSHSMERIFGYIVKYHNMNFVYPSHKIIKILNNEAPNKKYFQLIKIYNNDCYLLEDPNVYGNIIINTNNELTINWLHMNSAQLQSYKKISKNTIIKKQ